MPTVEGRETNLNAPRGRECLTGTNGKARMHALQKAACTGGGAWQNCDLGEMSVLHKQELRLVRGRVCCWRCGEGLLKFSPNGQQKKKVSLFQIIGSDAIFREKVHPTT